MGDGVLIYFGWPEAHEANAERAVRAALAVIEAIGQAPVRTETLQVRIGIATGLVVMGEPIGTGEARQQTAIGETPNLAARLQGLAEPNGDRDRCRNPPADRRSVRLPRPRTGRVEGPAGAVPAWQVLEQAAVESRFEALHAGTLTPLIGRDEELELLLRRWRQAKRAKARWCCSPASRASANRA